MRADRLCGMRDENAREEKEKKDLWFPICLQSDQHLLGFDSACTLSSDRTRA